MNGITHFCAIAWLFLRHLRKPAPPLLVRYLTIVGSTHIYGFEDLRLEHRALHLRVENGRAMRRTCPAYLSLLNLSPDRYCESTGLFQSKYFPS